MDTFLVSSVFTCFALLSIRAISSSSTRIVYPPNPFTVSCGSCEAYLAFRSLCTRPSVLEEIVAVCLDGECYDDLRASSTLSRDIT